MIIKSGDFALVNIPPFYELSVHFVDMQLVQSGMTHISGEDLHIISTRRSSVGCTYQTCWHQSLMMFASLDYRNFVGERIRGCLVVGTFFF